MNHNKYVSSRYLGQLELSLEALRKVDEKELLSIPFFYEPLFDLVLVGVVAKIEEYLKDRLIVEVYSSDESLNKYAEAFIEYNEKWEHRCKKWKRAKDAEDKAQIKELIDESLDKHIYHNLKMITLFFYRISNVEIDKIGGFDKIQKMIEIRHKIIHPNIGNNRPPIYEILESCNIGLRFIEIVERKFILAGRCPICEDPWE